MIRRLWHFWISGHRWRVASAAFNKGLSDQGRDFGSVHCEGDKQRGWGYTEVVLRCDCGAFKKKRLIGNHSAIASADELAELERMAK